MSRGQGFEFVDPAQIVAWQDFVLQVIVHQSGWIVPVELPRRFTPTLPGSQRIFDREKGRGAV